MSKRKRLESDLVNVCQHHHFMKDEVLNLRSKLLHWYDLHKRSLPWRDEAKRSNTNERAYAVWVSEIMLQQTQVITVIDYYKKWMKKWPSLTDLASATVEEVHQVWSGLGYYSRGTRLHAGAKKVIKEMDGKIPDTAELLEKDIPGIGRYTAGAIASIAFGQVTGLVDGNVGRVFSRLRAVGADSGSSHYIEKMWQFAHQTVDESRPGDYNQALMELGATVCTPKNPACSECPVQSLCVAYQQVESEKKLSTQRLTARSDTLNTVAEIKDIEEVLQNCKLCLDSDNKWEKSLGVCNYPRKGRKKQARKERTVVCIFHQKSSDEENSEYFITQRPSTGLLAGLWEFPNRLIDGESEDLCQPLDMNNILLDKFDVPTSDVAKFTYINDVTHLFSHIHQTYIVYSVRLKPTCSFKENRTTPSKWVTKEEFLESAVSTAMKKVFKCYESVGDSNPKGKKANIKRNHSTDGKKQLAMDMFFNKK